MIGVLVFSYQNQMETFRMCTDYRQVNSVTKTDSFPVPRTDDCIDNIGQAKYVTKFDLLKAFCQIPLTDKAKEISAFVTPDGPPVILLLAVPRRLFCYGSLMVLDVVFRYLSLC